MGNKRRKSNIWENMALWCFVFWKWCFMKYCKNSCMIVQSRNYIVNFCKIKQELKTMDEWIQGFTAVIIIVGGRLWVNIELTKLFWLFICNVQCSFECMFNYFLRVQNNEFPLKTDPSSTFVFCTLIIRPKVLPISSISSQEAKKIFLGPWMTSFLTHSLCLHWHLQHLIGTLSLC